MIMQEKITVMKKTNSEFVEFVSIPQKLHLFKNPHRLPTEPMGIHHSPHTHTIPIPMGIPTPTAALPNSSHSASNILWKLSAHSVV